MRLLARTARPTPTPAHRWARTSAATGGGTVPDSSPNLLIAGTQQLSNGWCRIWLIDTASNTVASTYNVNTIPYASAVRVVQTAYSVQVTADQKPTPNGNWNNHDTLVAQTASANGNIAYPVTGVRLVVSGYSSGSVNLGMASWP